jgi:UDP-N-acetylmuramate dehydrogenase
MNAGAYGSEMKDVLKKVTVLDENGNIKEMKSEELELRL